MVVGVCWCSDNVECQFILFSELLGFWVVAVHSAKSTYLFN